MRITFTEAGLHRVGDSLVVAAKGQVFDVASAEDIERYTEGVHYVVVPDPAESPMPEDAQPADPSFADDPAESPAPDPEPAPEPETKTKRR